jgi:hypothetical protein
MDCPVCREEGRSEPLVFEYGEIESIPGDMELVPPPDKYPTNAECTFDPDHFFIVEVDEDEDRFSLIMEAQAPNEDEVYDFTLSDLDIELS